MQQFAAAGKPIKLLALQAVQSQASGGAALDSSGSLTRERDVLCARCTVLAGPATHRSTACGGSK